MRTQTPRICSFRDWLWGTRSVPMALTAAILMANQAHSVEYLNIDRGTEPFEVRGIIINQNSKSVIKNVQSRNEREEEPSTSAQLLGVVYRKDFYELGAATGHTKTELDSDSNTSNDFQLKAGALFRADDGVALAVTTRAVFEDEAENNDLLTFEISAGRHLDQFSGEVFVTHAQASASKVSKSYSLDEVGFAMKHEFNRYVTLLGSGSGIIINDVKYKNSSDTSDQQMYKFSVGIGSDPIPSLDVLFQIEASNIYVESFDQTDSKRFELTEDAVLTSLSLGFYF